MSRQRRNFSAKFKSDLVIELLKGEKDLNTLATENNIQPNLLRNWKKEFLNNASAVFDDKREENLKDKLAEERKEKAEYAKKVDELILRAKEMISSNKRIVCEWLKENPNFECVLPSGGTVCFLKYYFDLKSETFAKLLLTEKGVFFVPGSCFDKEYYFRLGLAQDSKQFKAGLDELSNFVDEHLIS